MRKSSVPHHCQSFGKGLLLFMSLSATAKRSLSLPTNSVSWSPAISSANPGFVLL